MIITNFISRLVVGFFRLITPGTVGVTIWPFIFIWPKVFKNDLGLVNHERIHIKQWLRYWIVLFPFVYVYQWLKFGYRDMPLERETRRG